MTTQESLIKYRLDEINKLLTNNIYDTPIYEIVNTKTIEILNILDGMEGVE